MAKKPATASAEPKLVTPAIRDQTRKLGAGAGSDYVRANLVVLL